MPDRRTIQTVALFATLAIGVTVYFAPRLLPRLRPVEPKSVQRLPSLEGLEWVNAPRSYADSLRGHPVVLLQWGDTDPRSAAALEVVDSWRTLYAPFGVRVVAVHEPQFAFSADSAQAARTALRLAGGLPVALDPLQRVARAMDGPTDGPRATLADSSGALLADADDHLSVIEVALRKLILRRTPNAALPPLVAMPPHRRIRTFQLGSNRVISGPLRGAEIGRASVFIAPMRHEEGGERYTPYPVGAWSPGSDGVTAARGGAANFIAFRYSAARLGAVLSPPSDGSVRVWLLRDDHWPGADTFGDDVHTDGERVWVEVATPGLYWLEKGKGERTIKLSPDRSGVTVHAFVLEDAPR